MTPNKIFKTTSYLDKEGQEVEELSPIDGVGDTVYAVVFWLPMPSGPTSYTLIRTRIPVKDAKNIADAFNKAPQVKTDIENRMNEAMAKQDIIVPQSNIEIIKP